jgi:hypothetical protein
MQKILYKTTVIILSNNIIGGQNIPPTIYMETQRIIIKCIIFLLVKYIKI